MNPGPFCKKPGLAPGQVDYARAICAERTRMGTSSPAAFSIFSG
jgi:hypothetical protein